MRIAHIISIGLILCLALCIDQLSAGRCLRNKGRRTPCKSNGPVCCSDSSVTHCVRPKRVKIDGKKTTQWVLCDKSGRKFRRCSCMIGCRITEYTSKYDYTVSIVPVNGELRKGCKVYGCKAIYNGYNTKVPLQCREYLKQSVGSCFSLYRGKK